MLAIYRKNPQAFAGGKLNGLYRGACLTPPTQEQIRAESEAQAQQLMRNGRMTLTARTSTKPATTSTVVDAATPATPKATRVIKLFRQPSRQLSLHRHKRLPSRWSN